MILYNFMNLLLNKTILITVPTFRVFYLLRLNYSGRVSIFYNKYGVLKRFRRIGLKKLSKLVLNVIRQHQRVPWRKPKFVPKNTPRGLLLTIPEWWSIKRYNIVRSQYQFFANKFLQKVPSRLRSVRTLFCLRRTKKYRWKFFYKRRVRALNISVSRYVALFNFFFFFKFIFCKKSNIERFPFLVSRKKNIKHFSVLSIVSHLGIRSLYYYLKNMFFISISNFFFVFFSRILNFLSSRQLVFSLSFTWFIRKLFNSSALLYRLIRLGVLGRAIYVYFKTFKEIFYFIKIMQFNVLFSFRFTFVKVLCLYFFSGRIDKLENSLLPTVLGIQRRLFFLKMNKLIFSRVSSVRFAKNIKKGILFLRSTPYNTYVTFIFRGHLLYKKSAGMFEPNRKLRKTHKVYYALSEHFLIYFRRYLIRYGIRELEFFFSGYRKVEKYFIRRLSKFRREHLHVFFDAWWSMYRLIRHYRRSCTLKKLKKRFSFNIFRGYIKRFIQQYRHALIFLFTRKYMFFVHNKPFNGCRGRLLKIKRK